MVSWIVLSGQGKITKPNQELLADLVSNLPNLFWKIAKTELAGNCYNSLDAGRDS
jgi:hypothetical protein